MAAIERALQFAQIPDDHSTILQCHYYMYAHAPADPRQVALAAARKLMSEGVRSEWWDFSRNIERAEKDGHPNVPLLKALATVIAGSADLSTLDQFEEWRKAAQP